MCRRAIRSKTFPFAIRGEIWFPLGPSPFQRVSQLIEFIVTHKHNEGYNGRMERKIEQVTSDVK
jgi:hypothetical protein